MKKVILLVSMLTVASMGPSQACPFDEAGVEVTILAHDAILSAIESGNYSQASEEIIKQKYLYEYFEESSPTPLYQPMLDASNQKNGELVKKLLDQSLVLEVHELLGQVEEGFDRYQQSRLRLVKAKKHLKVLTSEAEPMNNMKKILKSIGNPGLMGMGKREPDKALFIENRDKLYSIIG